MSIALSLIIHVSLIFLNNSWNHSTDKSKSCCQQQSAVISTYSASKTTKELAACISNEHKTSTRGLMSLYLPMFRCTAQIWKKLRPSTTTEGRPAAGRSSQGSASKVDGWCGQEQLTGILASYSNSGWAAGVTTETPKRWLARWRMVARSHPQWSLFGCQIAWTQWGLWMVSERNRVHSDHRFGCCCIELFQNINNNWHFACKTWHFLVFQIIRDCSQEWVSEQFLNGTSAQYRLCRVILLKLNSYNRFKNNSSSEID